MRITIEKIDPEAPRDIGESPTCGYPVMFRSSMAQGWATFIPVDGEVAGWAGQSVSVEINQERVSSLQILGASPRRDPQVTALDERGHYEVCGVVAAIVPFIEPEGEQLVVVAAGDASFTFLRTEIGCRLLRTGEWVTFVAEDVSLWDEGL
jgi:hypothetical protein